MHKKLPMLLTLLALSLTASPASAGGKFNAVVSGKSYHFDSTYDWNEDNFGLGLEHEFEQKSAWKKIAMVNGFRDSTDSMSYMAGAGLHRRIYETEQLAGFYIYAGLNAFLMTRDDVDSGRPFPGVLPSISIGNRNIGMNLTYLPRQALESALDAQVVDPTLSGLLFLQFKVSLDQLLP